MLQGRIFAYADAHRYRVGTHYEALPVNRPRCPCTRTTPTAPCASTRRRAPTPTTSRTPSTARKKTSVAEPPLKITGNADRYNHREGNDDYVQVRALFNLFDAGQKSRLFQNYAEALQGVPEFIVERQLGHLNKVDPAFDAGVRAAIAALKA